MFPEGGAAFGNCRHSGSLKAGAQEYVPADSSARRMAIRRRLPWFPETHNGRMLVPVGHSDRHRRTVLILQEL